MNSEEALAEIETAVREGRSANLAGANLRSAQLISTNLQGANLTGANLTDASLPIANLSRAILEGADLDRADLRSANLSYANLDSASLKSANLTGADLTDAILRGANLTRANLKGAYLAGANLTGANLDGANLTRADLTRANLRDARLGGVNLTRANLTGANLTRANLTDANLEGANLTDADLEGANLRGASLTGADLEGANLTDANLDGASLADANLFAANLADASLTGALVADANLSRANLLGADLRGASLTRANLYGANLTRAHLTDANLTGANLEDTDGLDALGDATGVTWPAGFSLPTPEVTPYRAYGKQSAAVLKLRKPDTPRAAKEFKKKYPTEFEVLKQDTQGRDFSDQIIAQIAARHVTPFDWAITYGKYTSGMQRLCSEPNKVIKANVDLTDPRFTDREREILGKIREISRQSGHPTERHPFFTIGWVRYCELPNIKTILVEEVQSDVQGVRKGLKDPATRRQLESGGLNAEEIEAATALLLPYTERFYEDALGIIFDIAQKSGSKVEMLHYDTKRRFGSPSAVYTDLPRSMGMKLSPGSDVLPGDDDVKQTWKITPNRKRTSRRPARKTSRGTRRTSRR